MTTVKSSKDGEDAELRSTRTSNSESEQQAGAIQGALQVSSYDMSKDDANLDEVTDPPPVQNPDENSIFRVRTLEEGRPSKPRENMSIGSRRRSGSYPQSSGYAIPDNYANLDELAAPSPVENPGEDPIYQHKSLEEAKNRELEERNTVTKSEDPDRAVQDETEKKLQVTRFATHLYTISYLILFSFLGTLARLGLQDITFYSGAPVVFSELWANFGGSLLMGFLSEDRMLFKEEWGKPIYHQKIQQARKQADEESCPDHTVDLQAAKQAHAATKKTIPMYIGLATGFCGCFTSFSSFIRDAFLAMSNELPAPLNHPEDYSPALATSTSTVHRNGGYSFMAILAVIITTVALCISALHIGAHIAIATEPFVPSLPFKFGRKILDRSAVFLAWGCWLGALLLAIFPPDRHSGGIEIWRGRAVFSLLFAPIGCLGRFYISLYLNGKMASFPLGTFVVNILGTAILGMSYDLQRAPLGGVVGCQVLQGIEDGLCGCLTTVSTWVSELSTLKRRNAYRYGGLSVVIAFCLMTIIMGSMQWTRGFSSLQCTH